MVRNRHKIVLQTVCIHMGKHDGEEVIIKGARKRMIYQCQKQECFNFPLRAIFAEIPHFVYPILCLPQPCVQHRVFVSAQP